MTDREPRESRRRILRLAGTGSVAGLAGCLELGANGDPRPERPDDWCLEELEGEVPEAEANAPSIDGVERQGEDELDSKSDAGYECGARDGSQCGNCTFYIDDRDGDAIGACTEVEGPIRSADWCALWQPREKMGAND